MSDTTEDAAAVRRAWNDVAAGWQRWWATIEDGAQAVTARLLALADVAPGYRVLDVATGLGEPALTAAQRVGPTGFVLATDLSPDMLAIARARALALGVTNVEFREADAAALDLPAAPFDAILCRWGITSLPDPVTTMTALRASLAPTGAFATAVWEAGPTGRPLASLATTLADALFGPPTSSAHPPADERSVAPLLADTLRRAGFTTVHTESMTIPFTWRSPAECIEYLRDVSPNLRARLAAQPAARQAAYRRQLVRQLAPYSTADGRVRIPNVTLCAVGRG
ncbi:MAG: methyltransferase domain-containing protein [Gemmatimonadaceae bacterium]|jgi:ubiquinone/menaquinone biosynthesis C-methylase UbiE|nr:methyltransferase domain-containing protein [Gemmatimonadaceae bacterium]